MSVRLLAAVLGVSAAISAGIVGVHDIPTASADPDGGVCARLNGVPFYIPPQGYMPQPGEVITGPVTAGPCQESAATRPSMPELPQPALTPSSSSSPPSPPPPLP
jgi:hypothetical protein